MIYLSNFKEYKLTLIDNGSTDNMKLAIGSLPVEYIRSDENLGYAKAFNKYTKDCQSPYLMSINNDCYVDRNCIGNLFQTLQTDLKIGVISGKLIFPNSNVIQGCGSTIDNNCSPIERYKGVLVNSHLVNKKEYIEAISFACTITPTKLWKQIGGFNEEYYPGGHDDMEYCMRARELGYHICYEPSAVAVHDEHSTFARSKEAWDQYVKASREKCDQLFRTRWKDKFRNLPL